MQNVLGEFDTLLLPDKRLENRLRALAVAAWKAPNKSFPQMLEDEAGGLLAAYRLLNNARVEFDAVLRPHQTQTVKRARNASSLVVAHDPSSIQTPYADPEDVGYLNTGAAGYQAVFSLLMSVEPNHPVRPLGIVSVQAMFRAKRSQSGRKKRSSGAETARWQDKESVSWERAIMATAQALQGTATPVHVMDRGADSYALFSLIEQLQHGFVVRLRNDRRARHVDDEEDEWSSLGKLACQMQGVFEREVPLSKRGAKGPPAQRRTHPRRSARNATLHFSATPVEISKPKYLTDVDDSLHLSLVRVWEPDPPKGEPPVEWLLITNEPADTPEEILRVVDLYRARWTVEEFFKALKTGCALEERQFESRHALLNCLALLLPIAVHLLWLRTCARETPDADANAVFTPLQLTVLRHRARRKLPDNPTARQALWALAGIGGHIPNNGEPGWQVLGRAFLKLLEVTEGWRLAMQAVAEQKM